MTTLDALRLLIANGRTAGLADKAARLCTLGLISEADMDAVTAELDRRDNQ